jgi:hypothetical protein
MFKTISGASVIIFIIIITHSFGRPICTLVRSPIHTLVWWCIHTLVQSPIHTLIRSPIHTLVWWSIHNSDGGPSSQDDTSLSSDAVSQ